MQNTFSAPIFATRVARWGWPWLALLAVATSAAYGMTTAVAGAQPVVGRAEPAPPAIDAPVSSAACDPTSTWMVQNAVANGWIPARSADYYSSH